MEKYIAGSVIALLFALLCLTGSAVAEETETILIDDIEPYNGPIGPGSPLYGLKLALEDMDESFTADEAERVDKQMKHGRLRLSEVRRSLELNQSESAQEALNNYWQKMDLANVTLSKWQSNSTGLVHAQEQIVRHQFVLENLIQTHPNNTGLQRAYNNSLRLEEKFGEKTMVRFNRTVNKNNQTIMKAFRLEIKDRDKHGWPDTTTTSTTATTRPDDKLKGYEKDKGNGSGNGNPVTTVPTQVTTTDRQQGQGKGQGNQPDDKPTGNSGGNSDNPGKGNSKNK